MYVFLNFGERHDVKFNVSRVRGNDFCKAYDFFFCLLARVRHAVEVDRVDLKPAFCHHIRRDGAVDAAGQQTKRFAARSYGHAAGAVNFVKEDISISVFAYIDVNFFVKVCEIHRRFGIFFQNVAADFRSHNGAWDFDAFIRPSYRHAEFQRRIVKQIDRRFSYFVKIRFDLVCDAQRINAEYFFQPFDDFRFKVDVVIGHDVSVLRR